MDTLNRRIRKYKKTGRAETCKRTKYCEKRFSDEVLREHVLKNPSAAPEESALFFSVKHQPVYARMKALGITREKRPFFMKKETRKKDANSSEE